MTTKTKRVVYIVATSLLTLMILATIGNSIFNLGFTKRFTEIGYPAYLIAPLMTSKGLGLIAIWSKESKLLKEWAYSGFFFLFLLALLAEMNAAVPDYFSPIVALVLLLTSYILSKKAVNK